MIATNRYLIHRFFRTFLGCLLLLFSIFSPSYDASAQLLRVSQAHISDEANILDLSTKQDILTFLRDVYAKTGVYILIVTAPSLGGKTIEEYTNSYVIGSELKLFEAGGIIFVIAPVERKIRIQFTGPLDRTLSGAIVANIIKETVAPRMKQNRIDDGVVAGIDAIISALGNGGIDISHLPRKEISSLEEAKAAARQSCGATPQVTGGPWFSSTYKVGALDEASRQVNSSEFFCIIKIEYISPAVNPMGGHAARANFFGFVYTDGPNIIKKNAIIDFAY